ncbi:hypothetical protein GUJ93_ZPchr0005g14651 [Zizania palustris]|uniref:Uncharacterized protein n=1 Tax=Zizania palustris TaxID=103762 RepID=A0A8J5S228_ZIZPA|nr:hypothetical protein GUJ93_ZPchr0005g14651 [Zizania palustris]
MMIRGGAAKNMMSNELPVDGAVRVRKVERIQAAYNLFAKPPVSYTTTTTAPRQAESMAVSVVRVGNVDAKKAADGFVSVAIAND